MAEGCAEGWNGGLGVGLERIGDGVSACNIRDGEDVCGELAGGDGNVVFSVPSRSF